MGLLPSVDACMPRHTGIQSTQDRPAFYAASTDEDRSTSPISRHAYGRTATAHNPSMDRTALPAQPGNTQNVFAAGGSGWVHG